jgi:hypothetical protein
MSAVKRVRGSKAKALTFKQIDYKINYRPAGIKTSKDLVPCTEIIGQERAVDSIKLGLNVKNRNRPDNNYQAPPGEA